MCHKEGANVPKYSFISSVCANFPERPDKFSRFREHVTVSRGLHGAQEWSGAENRKKVVA